MGLDFTSIKDREGAAVYMLHDGTMTQQQRLDALADALRKLDPDIHVVSLSVRDRDGERIRGFYALDIASLPHVLVIRDNDELAQSWSGQQLPSADVIAHTVHGISGGR